MDITDIKRWQWAVLGIIAGLALGYVWSSGEPVGAGRKVSQLDFERDLTRKDPKSGEPVLQKIVVHPQTTDYHGKKVQPVTFLRQMRGAKDGKVYKVWAQLIAPVPYKPQSGPRGTGATGKSADAFAVADYLKNVAQQNNAVRFRYGWESVRPVAMTAWTVGALVVVGGLWPTLLNVLVGAGLGGQREKKKKEDYFARFSHAPDPAKAARPAVSDAERDRLAAMNARIEEQLKAAGVLTDPSDREDPEGKILAPVRKLEGGELQPVAPMRKPEDDDEIEVKGEYYPVLIHHHKKHADDKDDKQADDGHSGHPERGDGEQAKP
jgi:hypothetical protein